MRAVPFINPSQLFVIEQVIPLHLFSLLEVFLLVKSERPLLWDDRVLRIKLTQVESINCQSFFCKDELVCLDQLEMQIVLQISSISIGQPHISEAGVIAVVPEETLFELAFLSQVLNYFSLPNKETLLLIGRVLFKEIIALVRKEEQLNQIKPALESLERFCFHI